MTTEFQQQDAADQGESSRRKRAFADRPTGVLIPGCIGHRLFRATCCLVLVAAVPGCRRPIEPPVPTAVQVMTLHREAVSSELRFTATVRERQRIEVSFKVPGTVAVMLQVPGLDGKPRDLQEGDEVRADEARPLVRLDNSDYRRRATAASDRLAQAQARQRATEATATAIRANFERMKALRQRESVAQQAFDDIRARRDSVEAELEGIAREISAAKVALQQAEDDLKNCDLALPIANATVSKKYAEIGERVQAGQPVLQVMDLSRVRVAFGVPDTRVNQFRLGQALTVMADAFPGKQSTGRISKTLPAADLRTRSFEIEVTIDEPDGLRPGMVVSLTAGRAQSLILLPMTAIGRGESPEQTTVFAVVSEGGRKIVRKRAVKLGGVYDNRIRLIEGDAGQPGEGDAIVATGAFRLSEGQEVRELEVWDPALRVGL